MRKAIVTVDGGIEVGVHPGKEALPMWNGRSVSVILTTYAEGNSNRGVIEDFYDTGDVDEVLVVNNNAEPGTADEVAATPARQVFEPRQGYGYAGCHGLAEATGDLLVNADVCDVVFGSRPKRELHRDGVNVGRFRLATLGRVRHPPLRPAPALAEGEAR